MSTLWQSRKTTPTKRGWYITGDEGEMQWRAWGRRSWWKQIGGGWIEWFDGNGEAMRYDWIPRSFHDLKLDLHQLPEVDDYLLEQLQKSTRHPRKKK